jgi:ribosomal protein L21E
VVKLGEFLHIAETLVNEWVLHLNDDRKSLFEVEKEIVRFINKIGNLLLTEVVEKVEEPTQENTIWVEGKKAVYKQMENLRIRNRFGEEIVKKRRTYYIPEEKKGYYPLDEKLGIDLCRRFSPLMTYLLSFFGGCEAYTPAAKQLSVALGFPVSSTAVQANTEATGRRLPHLPVHAIPNKKQSEHCDVMIVEIDGTMSPRIHEEEGVSGRKSLKQPTEYKECNVIAIEKYTNGKRIDRWVGAHYGKREGFDRYAGQTGMKMGQLQAQQVVFIADGAKHNWEIMQNNFPQSVGILDFYHALEHLGAFCDLYTNQQAGKQAYARWRSMLYEGKILQAIEDMKAVVYTKISTSDEAVKHINYFRNNMSRMDYDRYRARGYPIGSGLVEGQCKLVVNRRFKGNGMRWKAADNDAVLDIRLSILNNTLDKSFTPKPRTYQFASGF